MYVSNNPVFPSIITEIRCPCFDLIQPEIVRWIYDYKKTTEGVVVSNRNGWQSPDDFGKEESFSEFLDYIFSSIVVATKFYNINFDLLNMWININQTGAFNVKHNHPGSLLSGVFWIKTPENCGSLAFSSPNHFKEHPLMINADEKFKEKTNYYESYGYKNPTEGTMIIFPSHLEHFVEQNHSKEDRISISFNLNPTFE